MAKTRIEKIAGIEEEIAQLLAAKKELLQAQKESDRKERTNRLCKRAGHLESLLPDSIKLTNERFNVFLEKTVITEFAKRILRDLLAEQESESTANTDSTDTTSSAEPTVEPPKSVAKVEQTQRPTNAANVNKQTA